jgi:hypothetical protein
MKYAADRPYARSNGPISTSPASGTLSWESRTSGVIDLEDGGEEFGLALFSALPVSLETKSLFNRHNGIPHGSMLA